VGEGSLRRLERRESRDSLSNLIRHVSSRLCSQKEGGGDRRTLKRFLDPDRRDRYLHL